MIYAGPINGNKNYISPIPILKRSFSLLFKYTSKSNSPIFCSAKENFFAHSKIYIHIHYTTPPTPIIYIIFFNLSQQRQIIMNFGFSVNYKVQVALADGFPVCISLYNVFPYFPSIAIIFLVDPLSTKRKLQPWQHKLVIMTYRMVAGFLYEYICVIWE